jgi:hypothetical protein
MATINIPKSIEAPRTSVAATYRSRNHLERGTDPDAEVCLLSVVLDIMANRGILETAICNPKVVHTSRDIWRQRTFGARNCPERQGIKIAAKHHYGLSRAI